VVWQAEEEQMTEDVELEEIDIPPEEDLYVNMDCLAHKVSEVLPRGGLSIGTAMLSFHESWSAALRLAPLSMSKRATAKSRLWLKRFEVVLCENAS
jgi:hypothetical protein